MPTLTPSLWFDKNAEEAAKLLRRDLPEQPRRRMSAASPADNPSGKKGDVLTVDWELDGGRYNGHQRRPRLQVQ